MSKPTVSRLWIAAAGRVIDQAQSLLSHGEAAAITQRLRSAAFEVETLMDSVADGDGAERSAAVATLVQRFGGDAVDVDRTGAAAIAEAVEGACLDAGIDGPAARRLSDACRAAVLDAAASLDALVGP